MYVRLSRAAIVVFALLAYSTTFAQSVEYWKELTPPGGRSILTILGAGDKIYVGTDDKGVFVSTNRGQSWIPINGGLTRFNVPLIGGNDQIVLAYIVEFGLCRLSDDGQSWQRVGAGLPNNYIPDEIAIIGETIYISGAPLFDGSVPPPNSILVYRSTNRGTSWSSVTTPFGNPHGPIYATGSNLYCFYTSQGLKKLLRTPDSGQTWEQFTPPEFIGATTIAANDGSVVIGAMHGVWRVSPPHFQDWTFVPIPFWHFYVFQIIEHGGNFIFTDESSGYSSADGGRSWFPMGIYGEGVYTLSSTRHGIVAGTRLGFLYSNEYPYANAVSVSAASYAKYHAPDSIAAIFGKDLAKSTEVAAGLPLPTSLAGISVTVKDKIGNESLAAVFFVSPTQINFHIPPEMIPGDVLAIVRSTEGQTAAVFMHLLPIAPGIFTANPDGRGAPAGYVVRVLTDGTQQAAALFRFDQGQGKFVPSTVPLTPASARFYLVLFGTGWRSRSSLSSIDVLVERPFFSYYDSYRLTAVYAGPSSFLGQDQMNISLPRLPAGTYRVRIKVDGMLAYGLSDISIIITS